MTPLSAAVVALVAAIGAVEAVCPTNWVNYEYHCYFAYDVPLSWKEARDICRDMPGADLVSINTPKENTFLIGEFGYTSPIHADQSTYQWIGLNDISTEGSYVWSNGDSVLYTNWYPGQPSGGTSENCVEICDSSTWCDTGCELDHKFICKMIMP